jgi:predicted N-formylglutamate amidohydrolase
MAARAARPITPIVIAVHSFNPVYRGVARPWAIGIVYGERPRLGRALIAALRADDPSLIVGENEPYSSSHRVYRTLERHADGHGFDSVMIEIRNDLAADPASETAWAERLARLLAPLIHDAGRVA